MDDFLVDLKEALGLRDSGALFLDARSPREFAEATVPGALNLPVLGDEERARVGLAYKRQGAGAARLLAVDLVAPRIPELVRAALAAQGRANRKIVVFCWRGGERSRALTTFLRLAGLPAVQLRQGHKGFRRQVSDFFAQVRWGRLLVLRGLTGVGKTAFLGRLGAQGHPVIDLEALANHRGSAFGALGLGVQPSQKMFEALLWDALRRIPEDGYCLVEGESRHIGKCQLPPRVYQAMQEQTSLWLNASLDTRVARILRDYPVAAAARELYRAPICALRPRLGTEVVERLLGLLDDEDWSALVRELMVLYYDPLYRHSLPARRLEIDVDDEDGAARHIAAAIAQLLAGGVAPIGVAEVLPA
ncbi:tRNA 2-selenouridine(34) synthase MnmH [Geoalkalibacter halelectricus]|uniref:tRNA 2-selenouridine(34) synthase MnmH n=1 Tax=Geoalkalibacter halelectricus TaxID=2847045 RepID=A0ABY5ZQ56_9BACT|nr:tRNA 2-selenouridine(34) synthase MnmH [Geoalkalibacter halelectricus]MDO3378669.1 tRNA 2-selenouridine(34) synthase MnmH [Geoalkalibacter halelectricus]UWZ80020.1 tRNA 2-selenouridine(34) synthase MnmH [Geoalkalibacter halelectricus]